MKMRAIVMATGMNKEIAPLNERHPTQLLPLVDRPFIQHVVEYIVEQGITEFDFILNHYPEKIEAFLGNGARWGSTFRYHLARDTEKPYERLKILKAGQPQENVLFVHSDRLPQINLKNMDRKEGSATVFFQKSPGDSKKKQWTGWALLSWEHIQSLSGDLDESAFTEGMLSLIDREGGKMEDVENQLEIRSYQGIANSHKDVLTKKFQGLMLSCKEIDDSIWLSRNVTLHPTAKLIPPVFIGEHSSVGQGVRLGPNAFVGGNCVLDTRSTVKESIIFPGSYVGEALELSDVIVDKNRLINFRIGAEVPVTDDFILGSMMDRPFQRWIGRFCSLSAAIFLLVLLAPLILVTALVLKLIRGGQILYFHSVIALPAEANEAAWRTIKLWSFLPGTLPGEMKRIRGFRHFFLRFLPALINIAKGEISFVGVEPRSKEKMRELPKDWKSIYLRSKAGIITEAYIKFGENPLEEELYSAESMYSATANLGNDFKLLAQYFGTIFRI